MRKVVKQGHNQKRKNHPAYIVASQQGLKIGNPKDYVVVMGNHIIDGRRSVTLEAVLPEKLPVGMALRFKRDKDEIDVTVLNDYGDEVEVAFVDGSKTIVERKRLFKRVEFSTEPKVVHKSRLKQMFGESIAALFWDSKVRMRVPAASPPPRSKSNS